MVVARRIIFSRVPAKGYFKIDGLLQISEIPDIEPKAPYQVSHHPILLEYNAEEFENPHSVDFPDKLPDFVKTSYDHGNSLYTIIVLLNIFTRYHFFVYDSAQFWAIEIGNDSKKTISNGSVWVQNDYFPKTKLNFSENKFSDFTEQLIKVIPSKEYFQEYGPILADRELKIPDSFSQLLHKFLKMPKNVKTKFLNSCVLYSKSFDIYNISPSLFLVGIISAIENLIPTIKAQVCEKCGQPKYSVVSRFKEFFNRYTGGGNNKWANELYKARSSISHRGGLLLVDKMPWNPYFDEKIEREQLLIAVRIVLINWLISHQTKGKQE